LPSSENQAREYIGRVWHFAVIIFPEMASYVHGQEYLYAHGVLCPAMTSNGEAKEEYNTGITRGIATPPYPVTLVRREIAPTLTQCRCHEPIYTVSALITDDK